MCVTETHLLRSMPDSFTDLPGFRMIRNDTLGTFAKHGACVYVNSHIKFEQVEFNCANYVAIFLSDPYLYVVAIYRPP